MTIIKVENFFSVMIRENNFKVISPFKRMGFIKNQLRKIFSRFSIVTSFFLQKEVLKPVDSDTVIIFDSLMNRSILKKIQAKNKNKRIIFWYWNPVKKSLKPSKIPNGIEVWSYSKTDCKKYNLRYNTTFYFDEIQKYVKEKNSNCDISFVGKDKGRRKKIIPIKKKFALEKLEFSEKIIANNRLAKILSCYSFSNYVTYPEMINISANSKAILDFYIDVKSGISLRPLEAAVLNKKLITNNVTIMQELFYNKKNVYILNQDTRSFREFLEEEMEQYINIEYYEFKSWISRFLT